MTTMLRGWLTMMETPLVLNGFVKRAETYFAHKEIVSRTSAEKIHRLTYKDFAIRTRKLASALEKLGMTKGMKVGSFAWNQHRHLEAYFAVPCTGAVLHMINIRLADEHLEYIINHANDEILLVDIDLFETIERILPKLTTVKHIVVMSDTHDLPKSTFSNLYSYEQLLAEAQDDYAFPTDLDENLPAAMCYTSATTGFPKGVVYTHRGLVLHAINLGLVDSFSLSERSVALPVVPMFHVNAWGIPFASVNFGAKLVLPGPNFTSHTLIDLIEAERVTFTAGVPTIWMGVLQELEKEPRDMSSLEMVAAGGSASPPSLIQKFTHNFGIPYKTVYGMTETSPIVSVATLTSEMDNWRDEEKIAALSTQGLTVPLIETEIINENGEVPADGQTMGELRIRGPWISSEYYNDERTIDAYRDGWLYTGDIAVRTPQGNIKITDRTKDLIKSGGEWISSVDLENALMAHDAVFEAAVIAIPHIKWQERPLACVVLHEGYDTSVKEELTRFLATQVAKWWMPDDIVFVREIPKTSVGKFLKAKLRDDMKDYQVNS